MKLKTVRPLQDIALTSLVKDSSLVLISRVSGVALAFITNIIISRYYGAETVGIVALVTTFISIAVLLVLFGTNTSILKLIPQYRVKHSVNASFFVYRKTLYALFIWGLMISAALFFLSPLIANNVFGNPELTLFFSISSGFMVFIALKDYSLSALRALNDIKAFALLYFTFFITILFVVSVIAVFSYGENAAVFAFIFTPVLFFFLCTYYVYRKFERLKNENSLNGNKITLKDIYSVSAPMFLISGAHLLMSQADIIMIGIYLSETDVGIYFITVKLALVTSFVLSAVNSVVSPKFSHAYHSGDLDLLKKTARDSSKLIIFTTFPILFFLIALGYPVLGIFGEEFQAAYWILVILVIGQMVNSLSGSVGYFLNMTGNEKAYQKIILLGLLLNIILNAVLIPKYGNLGAAIATSSSLIFWNISSLMFMKSKFGYTTMYFGR